MHQISILVPLAVSTGAILCTIMIHTMPVGGTIWFFRRERKLGHMGRDFWSDTIIVVPVVLIAMVAHLIEIALWAIVFLLCGEFADIGTAYYHSAVNFTTLGSGECWDRWKLRPECSCLVSPRPWFSRLSRDWLRLGLLISEFETKPLFGGNCEAAAGRVLGRFVEFRSGRSTIE